MESAYRNRLGRAKQRGGETSHAGRIISGMDHATTRRLRAWQGVTVGTLFSSMTVHTRFAELLLPMLALPFFIPVVVPAAQASAKLLVGGALATVMPWIQVLVAFDLMFGVACVLAFPFTIED